MAQEVLNARAVRDILGITHDQLQRLTHLLPHAYIPALRRHLFLRRYIVALAEFLRNPAVPTGPDGVRQFNQSPQAVQITALARQELEAQINARGHHTAQQVAEILGVSESAVYAWREAHVLPFTVQTPKSATPGRPLRLTTAANIRAVLEWHVPATLQS